jgi:putative CocE/NonD family hydrolase
MAGPPTLVERQSRRDRPVLFLHAAVVDGDPEAALACLHRRLRRIERSLSRVGLSGRHSGRFFRQLLVESESHHQSPSTNGEFPREQTCDLNLLLQLHPTYDGFWRERCAAEHLHEIEVPLYSVGVWGKVDLHTRGNIDGFRRATGPKKLKMIGPLNAFVANREFNSRELHEKLLLPFYDHYLKGLKTDYLERPAVEYFVRGADATRATQSWPPTGVRYVSWHLSGGKTGSVTSLNGTLTRARRRVKRLFRIAIRIPAG